MGVSSLLVPLTLFLSHVLGAVVDPTLPFSDYLDPGNSTMLRWGFDLVKNSILFELRMKTAGWVGFGFSPSGGMAGADIVIGGVGPNGIYFTDRHAVGNSVPLLDEQQDYELVYLTEADGQTVMKFRRSISACDENDYPITVSKPSFQNFCCMFSFYRYLFTTIKNGCCTPAVKDKSRNFSPTRIGRCCLSDALYSCRMVSVQQEAYCIY
ncbi:hypothetical protein MHYP_G00059360 [Metynnis hypsauchen]